MSLLERWRGRAAAKERGQAEEVRRDGRAKGIFEDLLNLEINVMVTPGMTARKMPHTWNALFDIVEAYTTLLREFTIDVQGVWRARGSPRVEVFGDKALQRIERKPDPSMVGAAGRLQRIEVADLATTTADPSFEVFDQLRSWAAEAAAVACALLAEAGWPEPGKLNERVVLFKRIERNCDQLKDILQPPPGMDGPRVRVERGMELSPDQLLTVRKVWDVGTSTVVMQTVVQLDGDIVTRIHEGHSDASSQPLHALHRASVEGAIKNWQFLGETVAQFLTSVLKRFL